MEFCKIKGGLMKSAKRLIWIFLTFTIVCLLFWFAVKAKYEANLDFRFSYADVFQKNAGRIEDMQKREELCKLINKDSLKIEMSGDVRIRKIW